MTKTKTNTPQPPIETENSIVSFGNIVLDSNRAENDIIESFQKSIADQLTSKISKTTHLLKQARMRRRVTLRIIDETIKSNEPDLAIADKEISELTKTLFTLQSRKKVSDQHNLLSSEESNELINVPLLFNTVSESASASIIPPIHSTQQNTKRRKPSSFVQIEPGEIVIIDDDNVNNAKYTEITPQTEEVDIPFLNKPESDSESLIDNSDDEFDEIQFPIEFDLDDSTTDETETPTLAPISDSTYSERFSKWLKDQEVRKASGIESDVVISSDSGSSLTVPGDVWFKLFGYQKTALQWLFQLYTQKSGGLLGDEMGLGKTIQIIAFLASLWYTNIDFCRKKSFLIICPATLMSQWASEFRKWFPPIRTLFFHSSFSEDPSKKSSSLSSVLEKAKEGSCVVITTYQSTRIHQDSLVVEPWLYVILDEGHKIRNPEAGISIACKKFRTVNRIILSGCPIQNNLKEFWSLFDFIFPGKLGTLTDFMIEFAIPISIAGYHNATPAQVKTAYQCSLALAQLLKPYLLRRLKSKVQADLPKKIEQVVFVELEPIQRKLYEAFLSSKPFLEVVDRKLNCLFAIDILRKICNHPDLLSYRDKPISGNGADSLFSFSNKNKSRRRRGKKPSTAKLTGSKRLRDPDFDGLVIPGRESTEISDTFSTFLKKNGGNDNRSRTSTFTHLRWANPIMDDFLQLKKWSKSGKLLLLGKLLKSWNSLNQRLEEEEDTTTTASTVPGVGPVIKKNVKVLIFTQTVQMLRIIEDFCCDLGYSYYTMDGTVPLSQRQSIISKFNADSTFLFILTTRVGGLGTNLTGANRVIIFDPDWNPSTDAQARERAWRIGQQREVTIYRFISRGTIEEKIFTRQVFKQFLTTKVLKDPSHRKFLQHSSFTDLFTLAPPLKKKSNSSANKSKVPLSTQSSIQDSEPLETLHIDSIADVENYISQTHGDSLPPRDSASSSSSIEEMMQDGDAGLLKHIFDSESTQVKDHDLIISGGKNVDSKFNEQLNKRAKAIALRAVTNLENKYKARQYKAVSKVPVQISDDDDDYTVPGHPTDFHSIQDVANFGRPMETSVGFTSMKLPTNISIPRPSPSPFIDPEQSLSRHSSSILSKIQAQQRKPQSPKKKRVPISAPKINIAEEIAKFLSSQPGYSCNSNELSVHMAPKLTKSQISPYKEILKKICKITSLQLGSKKLRKYKLLPEYRDIYL